MPGLVADPDLVTPAWLTDVLRHGGAIDVGTHVLTVERTVIGTGQVGTAVRFALTYDDEGPPTVVGKFASRDPRSRAAAVASGAYETEVAFYREVAETVSITRPLCWFAAVRPGSPDVALIMEDLAPAVQGDQVAGCSVEVASAAVDEAANLHGPRWNDESLRMHTWLDRAWWPAEIAAYVSSVWDDFVDRFRTALDDVTVEIGEQLAELLARRGTPSRPVTVVHFDYRLDNMLFGTGGDGRGLTVVDWQSAQLGLGPADVAYFLGSGLAPEVRRSCEEMLISRYHDGLTAHGVRGYSLDECWDDYRRSSLASLTTAVFASMRVGRTDRGDAMFLAMANRGAQMAADLRAADLLRGP